MQTKKKHCLSIISIYIYIHRDRQIDIYIYILIRIIFSANTFKKSFTQNLGKTAKMYTKNSDLNMIKTVLINKMITHFLKNSQTKSKN